LKAINILRNCPDLDIETVKKHIQVLGSRYSALFSVHDVCRHIRNLNSVTPDKPVKVYAEQSRSGISCTVIAYDFPFVFSIITGILASLGMDIKSGEIFTLKTSERKPRKIIDYFTGSVPPGIDIADWKRNVESALKEPFMLLEKGCEEAVSNAKSMVNEMAARSLAASMKASPVLYPIEINLDNSMPDFNRMQVFTEDTPFFLYAMGTALSMQNISIEHVSIKTVGKRVEDEFLFTDLKKKKILDSVKLDRLKLSVLFTKQFTYFLSISPDPYTALVRFEDLLHSMLIMHNKSEWLNTLSDPDILYGLARLLGVSDFLWEDFIRLHYETLIPMLRPYLKNRTFTEEPESLCSRFKGYIKTAKNLKAKEKLLNEFKDREIFLMDLNHILTPQWDLRRLSINLTQLAECILDYAFAEIYTDLSGQYGRPRTVAGVEAEYSILGLGKMGGSALGYASDIEIMVVYSDNGETDGNNSIPNSQFFEEVVKRAVKLIHSKQEGIFQIDLRLRPYGKSGPLACSLDRFCRYYGRGGKAHSYERLALVRLRAVGGSIEFGSMVERIRDDIVYTSQSIDVEEIRELREKQYKEKAKGKKLNAKYSPGALVDLEYAVQILQVKYGGKYSVLKTPRIHEALNGLASTGVLEPGESDNLVNAYYFLREVINGLRMLRGSAKDLFLPERDSPEFDHLARRLNYKYSDGITPAQALHIDFELHTARIRAFLKKHLGKRSIPGEGFGNIADLIMYDEISDSRKKLILSRIGITDINRAYKNLKKLSGNKKLSGKRNEEEAILDIFSKLAVLAADILVRLPDPDMALNNWERFSASLSDLKENYSLLLSQPKRLDILLNIFSGSQFLSNTLINNPDFFDWITISKVINNVRSKSDMFNDMHSHLDAFLSDDSAWLNGLRKFKKRELLRIGTRDICFNKSIKEIMLELSELAECIVEVVTEKEKNEYRNSILDYFCIFAFGKLGGEELNYSSDIDLLAVYDDSEIGDEDVPELKKAVRKIFRDISVHTDEGYCYRVDLRLRPYGSSGEVAYPFSGFLRYYREKAALWEIQALIKLRPIAGNTAFGKVVLDIVKPAAFTRFSREDTIASVKGLRNRTNSENDKENIDIKNGYGGIRDIEFSVQVLQLVYGRINNDIININTLKSLELLTDSGIITEDRKEQIVKDYLFLRRVEHFLQIFENRQLHVIPDKPGKVTALAKRVLGRNVSADQFFSLLKDCRKRVRSSYEEIFASF